LDIVVQSASLYVFAIAPSIVDGLRQSGG